MENARPDMRVVFGHELTGLFVQRDETRRERRRNIRVRPILPVGCAGVNQIVHDQHRTIGRIVRKHAQLIHHVIAPNNIRVFGADFGWRFAGADHVFRFVFKGAIIPIGHPINVQAHDFAAAGHDVDAVALNGRRRQQPKVLPVIHLAGFQFRDHQLPQEFTGLLIEHHQDAAVALMLRIAWRFVVRADEHFSTRDRHVAVTL